MVGDAETQPTDNVTLSSLAEELGATEFVDDEPGDGEDVDEEAEDEAADESEDEDGEDADEDGEQQEEATFTIKVNGKDVTLKQSEMVEMAQKGSDYTEKTMAVAEERKAVEQVRAQAEQYRQQNEQALNQAAQQAQAFAQFIESQLGEPPSIDILHTQGSDVYLAHKEQYEARRGQLYQAQTAIQHLQGEAHRQRQAWIAQQADETEKALRDTLPGWSDDTLTELADYAGKLGLNPRTVDVAFVQKGLWQALHKAKAYDELQAKKATLKPKSQLAKVQKPSAGNQPNRATLSKAEAEKRFAAKPGSIDALAALVG